MECDAEAADELALRFNVEAVPYIVILGSDGSILATHEGLDADALHAVFERAVAPIRTEKASTNGDKRSDASITISTQRSSYSGTGCY